jgi:hypothetical protein
MGPASAVPALTGRQTVTDQCPWRSRRARRCRGGQHLKLPGKPSGAASITLIPTPFGQESYPPLAYCQFSDL